MSLKILENLLLKTYNMSITQLYFIILAIIIPFLYFILPILFNLINYSYWIPKEFIISLIVSIIIMIVFIIYHIQTTNEACQKTNNTAAVITGLKAFLLVLVTMNAINYYPSILQPFLSVFMFNSELSRSIYSSIIVYAVVFLYLTNVSFTSIKETCKANIEQIKQVYKQLESKIK